MASKTDSVIFYQRQVDICKKHLTPEQFGRLMYALFELNEGNEPEVDDDISMAFDFMALQQRIDRDKYEEKCKKNRENGKLGGRPKKPKKANGFSENPAKTLGFLKNPNDNDNDNDNENENENENDNGFQQQHFLSLGVYGNVNLTEEEYEDLKHTYEHPHDLVDKVSLWIKNAKGPVPNHHSMCVKFAINENWPKRKVIEPPEPIVIEDPLNPEEQAAAVAQMRAKVNGLFPDS